MGQNRESEGTWDVPLLDRRADGHTPRFVLCRRGTSDTSRPFELTLDQERATRSKCCPFWCPFPSVLAQHQWAAIPADRAVCRGKARLNVGIVAFLGLPGKRVYVKSVTRVRIPPHPSIPPGVRRGVGSPFSPVPHLGSQFRLSVDSDAVHSRPPALGGVITTLPKRSE